MSDDDMHPVDIANVQQHYYHYRNGRKSRDLTLDVCMRALKEIAEMGEKTDSYDYAIAYWLGAVHYQEREE